MVTMSLYPLVHVPITHNIRLLFVYLCLLTKYSVFMFQWYVGGNAALIAQNIAKAFPDIKVCITALVQGINTTV